MRGHFGKGVTWGMFHLGSCPNSGTFFFFFLGGGGPYYFGDLTGTPN